MLRCRTLFDVTKTPAWRKRNTTNNLGQRGSAWFAGEVVLLAMWIYFALRILLLIRGKRSVSRIESSE